MVRQLDSWLRRIERLVLGTDDRQLGNKELWTATDSNSNLPR